MITKRYKIAEKVAEINSMYEDVHLLCADYETEDAADYSITTTQADIEFERVRSARERTGKGLPLLHSPDSYLETLAVYRKISVQMLKWDTFLFHGSAIAVDGEAYLFTAKSGTGKSTHTRFWREYFGERAVMVNDDKPLIRVGEQVTVFGTPYNGKHHLGENIAVPLRAVCILTRDTENHIARITKAEAYAMLVQQVYRPQDAAQMAKTLQLVDRLAEQTALYKLGCNMDISAAEVAYHGMHGGA